MARHFDCESKHVEGDGEKNFLYRRAKRRLFTEDVDFLGGVEAKRPSNFLIFHGSLFHLILYCGG